MKRTIRIPMMLATIVFTFCFFDVDQRISAQSTDDCMKVKGTFVQDSSSGRNLGTITNGGILNGRTEIVFNPAASPTLDPTTVSFIGDLTVTTHRGVLKTHDVYLFDFSTAAGTGIHRIDPDASTGLFAGATGVLYDNVRQPGPVTVEGTVAGAICFGQ
jgi:hypothetical protein